MYAEMYQNRAAGCKFDTSEANIRFGGWLQFCIPYKAAASCLMGPKK
jgi:hypothetical protein